MANVPVTGLSALGNVLAEFGDTYARNARQDQLIAQQRAQQLEDVNRAVALEETRYRRGREDTLKDIESSRTREDTVSARHRGEVLEDVGSNRMFAIALQDRDRAIKLADRAQFETDLKSLVNDSALELKNVQGRINEALAEINKPEPVVNANDRAVQELAQQLAGGSRKKEDIALMVPKALEQIQLRAMMTHQQNVRSAHEALLSWKNTEIQLRQIIESGIQKNVAPSVAPPTSNPVTGSLMAPGQPMRTATAADLANAVRQVLGGGQPGGAGPAAPAGGGPAMLPNPTNNPAIEAGNVELAAQGKASAAATLNEIRRQLESVDAELGSVSATTKTPSLGMGLGGYSVTQVANPLAAANRASGLLKQKADLEARQRALQEQLLGPVPGSVAPPAINTPTSSTPRSPFFQSADWWKMSP